MDLEDSTGKMLNNASLEDVLACIDRIGKDLDHCILGEGDDFIQTASSGSGLLVEYGDSGGLVAAGDEVLSREVVKELFTAFYNHDPSWKTKVSFSQQSGASGSSAGPMTSGSTSGASQNATGFDQRPLKDTVMDSVKREAQSSFSYMIRRIIRRLIRKVF